jgi:hypothetical protein
VNTFKMFLVLAMVVTTVLSAAVVARSPVSKIHVPQDVPSEVQTIVDSTWASFLEAFPSRAKCLTEPTLLLEATLDEGDASYTRSTGIIRIRIPTSPERFPESLAHELGHHLDESCSFGATLGAELMATQGLSLDGKWAEGEHWREIPAEHFAEAVTQIVLGTRITFDDRVVLNLETVRLVAGWGRHH